MPSVRYSGPHDEVDLPTLGVTCKRGEAVDVPDESVSALTDQPCWDLADENVPTVPAKDGE
ncbi:hypothetical protein acdb102_31240 [Acidothermaceae bacterium B102]|nr:hypothetical protein acdb102_31240 [Acidothermaceae bacterium B102]